MEKNEASGSAREEGGVKTPLPGGRRGGLRERLDGRLPDEKGKARKFLAKAVFVLNKGECPWNCRA